MHKLNLLAAAAVASLGLSTSAVLVAQPTETPASDKAADPATPATPATPADPKADAAATPATHADPATSATKQGDDPLAPTADEVKAEKAKAKNKAAKKPEFRSR